MHHKYSYSKVNLHLYHADIIGAVADSQRDSSRVMTSYQRHKLSFL